MSEKTTKAAWALHQLTKTQQRNFSKLQFQSLIIRQGFLKKKAVQVHDLTEELSDYYANIHGLIQIHIFKVKNLTNNIRCGWSIEERQRMAGTLIFTTCAPLVCICTC